MIKLYGIPNCDTVKKARKAIESRGVDYEFIDFKKVEISKKQIESWKKSFEDWPVNKRGTTYRKVKEEFESATDAKKMKIILENTSMIKRPILEKGSKVVGFGFDLGVIEAL